MNWFGKKRRQAPEEESTAADEIRELRQAYAEISAKPRDAWAWFPLIFQIAFGLLSFLGTYIGLRDIISTGDLNAGPVGDFMVFGLVALATVAMIYFLRRTVSDPFSFVGAGSLVAYLALVFFSVTFGFAFYWGRLEARQQAVAGASLRLEEFSDQINITAIGLQRTVDELSALEAEFVRLADIEETQGGTCGDGSGSGFGPRTRHRHRRAEEIRARVAQLTPRFQSVAPSVAALEAKMAEIAALGAKGAENAGGEARRALFREARLSARNAAVQINSVGADPLLTEVSSLFSAWGQEYKTPNLARRDDPGGQSYVCYQVSAGDALASAGSRLANLPTVDVPDLPDFVGPSATREAVFRMLHSAGDAGSAIWAGVPLIGSRPENRFDSAATEAAYRAGVDAGLNAESDRDAEAAALLSGGLIARDRFPLLVAIIVDALLLIFVLIDRQPAQFFGRFQRKIRNAIEEKLNPMEMVALRRSLNDDPNWGLLRPYRFTVNDRIYLAQPLDARRSGTDDDIAEADMLQDLLSLWRRNGLVRRQDLNSEEIRAELRKAGADGLADKFKEFRCFRFTDRAFEMILMRGLFVGQSQPAERLAQRALANRKARPPVVIEPPIDAVADRARAAAVASVKAPNGERAGGEIVAAEAMDPLIAVDDAPARRPRRRWFGFQRLRDTLQLEPSQRLDDGRDG